MPSHRAICTLGGFFLARRDYFTPVAAKGASQVILVGLLLHKPSLSNCGFVQNITFPALLFSKMVPSFNASNIAAFGEFHPLITIEGYIATLLYSKQT